MSHSKDIINSPQKQPHDIVHWLLAVFEVVNAGGRLAPQKAIQKRQQELLETYSCDTVWQAISQFSMALGMGNAPYAEGQFRSHPDLPALLQTEESAKTINRWFQENSAVVSQAHHLLCGLLKLMPPSTTSKFAEGGVTPEQKGILRNVSQILGKEDNNEESSNLHTSL